MKNKGRFFDRSKGLVMMSVQKNSMVLNIVRVLTMVAIISSFQLCGESVSALSMTVNNSNLSSLVQSIARSEGIPITGTETLEGTVSIRLNETNGIAALQRLAAIKHFS